MTFKKILVFFKDNFKQIRTTLLGIINILIVIGVSISPTLQDKINEIFIILVTIDGALLTIFVGDGKKIA
jgi:hypothetical protein